MQSLPITRFKEILLPKDEPFLAYDLEGSESLGPLAVVNVLVGANNSGKSRLLRGLFAVDSFSYNTNQADLKGLDAVVTRARASFEEAFVAYKSLGPIGSETFKYPVEDVRFRNPRNKVLEELRKTCQLMAELDPRSLYSSTQTGRGVADSPAVLSRLIHLAKKTLDELEPFRDYDENAGGQKRFYIPVIRGMRPLDDDETNLYEKRTIQDYFPRLPENTQVFTGLELYRVLRRMLLGEPEERELIREFEEFLASTFFGGNQITLIPKEGQNTVHVRIGSDKQLPLYNLGDGLQSLIIMTFNMFVESGRQRCLFFIEEPDLFLHAGYQRALMDVMLKQETHQYFFTTHSNHFLDLTLDHSQVAVFHFSKGRRQGGDKSFTVKVVSEPSGSILRDLGAKNSSMLLTNATIWVEGPTDRLYFREYLRKYVQEIEGNGDGPLSRLREDIHYSFFIYGGSNLPHWSFEEQDEDLAKVKASRVCASGVLVVDGDKKHDKKLVKLYGEVMGDRFLLLPCKEIENLIPETILRMAASEILGEHAMLAGRANRANLIKWEEYCVEAQAYAAANHGLGAYLNRTFQVPAGAAVFTESGPDNEVKLKNKPGFCRRAVRLMNTAELDWTLPQPLMDLCGRILEHIQRQNA